MATNAFLFCGRKKPQGTVSITNNGVTDVSDYASASVNVMPSLQSKTVSPSTSAQAVTADSGYDGLSSVTVAAVTGSIDENLTPCNVRAGVTVLGVTGTLEEGETPPDHVICDGDIVNTLYFNTELSASYMRQFLSSLTYGTPEPVTGISYAYLGPGSLTAADLSGSGSVGEYALVWADINDPGVIYSTADSQAIGAAAGWQVSSFTPASTVTVDYGSMNAAFLTVKNRIMAKASVAFGSHGGNGKAHTFAVPRVSGSYAYNGSAQTPTVAGYYGDFMTVTGDTSETDPGNYSLIYTLNDTASCQWSDGTTGAKTVNWSIAKADPDLTLAKSVVRLYINKPSASFMATRDGDGEITAVSSDPSLLSVSVSNRTVSVTALSTAAASSAAVTVHVAETQNYAAADAVFSVEVFALRCSCFKIKVTSENAVMPLALRQSDENGLQIDWGDGGAAVTTPAGTDAGGTPQYSVLMSHTYAAIGNYVITISPLNGTLWSFGRQDGSGAYNVFNVISTALTTAGSGQPSGIEAFEFEGGYGLYTTGSCAFKYTYLNTFYAEESSMTSVSPYSFQGCSFLMSMKYPSTVTSIGPYAFADCTMMFQLYVKAATPPTIQSTTLSNMRAACYIYVPSSSVSAYKAASYWSARSSYINADS